MKRFKMHSDVVLLRNVLLGILCFMVVVTNQEEIRNTWNNRLYPTNSVYEASNQGSLQPPFSDNGVFSRVSEASRDSGRAETQEEVEEVEYEYEDEPYDEQNEQRPKSESKETHYEAKEDVAVDYEEEYYDDYDNATNSQASDNPIDYEQVESVSHEQFQNSKESLIDKQDNKSSLNNEASGNNAKLELKAEEDVKNAEVKVEEEQAQEKEAADEEEEDEVEEQEEQQNQQQVEEAEAKEQKVQEEEEEEQNADKKEPSEQEQPAADNKNSSQSSELESESILIGEAVVSVVTTKSVVNGTISIPTIMPSTTEQMSAPPTAISSSTDVPETLSASVAPNSPTTEDAMIVASVQTSRSISGARFLPFNLNTENENADKKNISDDVTNKTQPSESTESIIDKLDRVQSELSSGFLTGGFRTAGNALQLDVLSEQRPSTTRKTFTTTGRTPVINKFVPRKLNERKTSVATTEAFSSSTSSTIDALDLLNDQAQSTEKPKTSYRIPWPGVSRLRISTTEATRKATTTRKPYRKSNVEFEDISAFLPPGYKLNKEDQTTEKSILNDILAKSNINISTLLPKGFKPQEKNNGEDENGDKKNSAVKDPLQSLFTKSTVDISAFLPPGYNNEKKKGNDNDNESSANGEVKKESGEQISTSVSTPIQKSLQELFSKSSVDISALLPAGYKPSINSSSTVISKDGEKRKENSGLIISSAAEVSNLSSLIESTTRGSPGGVKLVFPSRPGGRKVVHKATTVANRIEAVAVGAVTPKIQRGWPIRATTEFTGWPTPSTTPISIEKLLEAARTATVSSINSSVVTTTSEAPTSTSTTTTTTTIRPTTPGVCEEECEVAGTIRIVGNTTWVPELLDRNTIEWQELASDIEKEINLVFLKSAILRKWYKNIRIDAFSQGSILVDYFIELQDLSQKINTQEIKVLFHESLRAYNAHKWNETKIKTPMRLGEFLIDPKSTDFVVIPKATLPQQIEKDDRLIPQWVIAVIVIGVGGLLFIIVFGVSVLVNRQNAAKLKPPISGMYGEEAAKNIIHSSHVPPSHRSQDYPKSEISTIWNETDAWREKSFESNSNKILMDGMLPDNEKYNVYDSWRSDWNGYYYQPSHTSSKFAGYESTANFSRHHHSDYDTNF